MITVEIFPGMEAPKTKDHYQNSDFLFTYNRQLTSLFNVVDGFGSD